MQGFCLRVGRAGVAWVLAMCLAWLSRAAIAFECPPLTESAQSSAAVSYVDSLLWEVQRAEESPSFLFGTIHLAARAVGQPSAAVSRALLTSSQFGMEVVFDLAAMREVAQHMRFSDGQRLSKVLGAPLFERTTELLADYGVSREDAERLKPWAVYTTLSLPQGRAETPLDLVLLGTARKADKQVFGLETVAEQTAAFERMNLTEQVALVTEAVCHYARLQQDTAELIAHYAAGDLAVVYRIAQRYESPAQDKLKESLLVERNRRMVARLQAPLAKGDAFIAIGALHLPGPDGVLAGLVALGYRVRPLSQ